MATASAKTLTDAAERPEKGKWKRSPIYQYIMTPINFVSFLLSLYLVDCHYNSQREHSHDGRQSRLPAWLHNFIYRPRPYLWIGDGPAPPNKDDERWYYHTKQKKLMKMEASDAFQMRGRVLIGLMLVGVGLAWGVWHLVRLAWTWYE